MDRTTGKEDPHSTRRFLPVRGELLISPGISNSPHTAEDHGLAGAGGIDGTLIAKKLGRRGQSAEWCVENLLQEPPIWLGERPGRLAVGHRHHRERATTVRLAPN